MPYMFYKYTDYERIARGAGFWTLDIFVLSQLPNL